MQDINASVGNVCKNDMANHRTYWPQLDGLRFFAALIVIIHHSQVQIYATAPNVIYGLKIAGWAGVNLFLTLSAYLLTKMLCKEVDIIGGVSLKKYFARRLLRIWPLYLVYVTASFLYALHDKGVSMQDVGILLSHFTFVNNVLVGTLGYGVALPDSVHLWTITLEEQLYLFLPMAIPFLHKNQVSNKRRIGYVFAGLLMLMTARASFALSGVNGAFIWTSVLRSDAFLLGVALGIGTFDGIRRRINSNISLLIGLLLFFLPSYLIGDPNTKLGSIFNYPIVDMGCVLIVMSCVDTNCLSSVLSAKPITYLGKISFGIYVFHIIAIRIATYLANTFSLGLELQLILAICCSVFLAQISYELFEKKILRFKKRFVLVENRPL